MHLNGSVSPFDRWPTSFACDICQGVTLTVCRGISKNIATAVILEYIHTGNTFRVVSVILICDVKASAVMAVLRYAPSKYRVWGKVRSRTLFPERGLLGEFLMVAVNSMTVIYYVLFVCLPVATLRGCILFFLINIRLCLNSTDFVAAKLYKINRAHNKTWRTRQLPLLTEGWQLVMNYCKLWGFQYSKSMTFPWAFTVFWVSC